MMKFMLKILLLVASIAVSLAEMPNCSLDDKMQKCMNNEYTPNPGTFMQTRKEMNDFCNIFRKEVECIHELDTRCGDVNPQMQQGYNAYEKLFDIMCKKKFQKRFLHHARCLNKAMGSAVEKCASNEIPHIRDEQRCTQMVEQLHCFDAEVKKECGRDALDIFKKVFHLTFKHFMVQPNNCPLSEGH